MLIALRVAIGWHFFQEGLAHKNEAHWSSEGFLRQAKGPLAGFYHGLAPGVHSRDAVLMTPLESESTGEADKAVAPEASRVYGAWYTTIANDWQKRLDQIAAFYKFDADQKKKVEELLVRYRTNLGKVLAEYQEDIAGYRYELFRTQQMAGGAQAGWQIPFVEREKKNPVAAAAEDIPSLKTRIAKREHDPTGEPGVNVETGPHDWTADVGALESALENDALALRTDAQRTLAPAPHAQSDLRQIDTAVIWTLIIGGGCLMIGLFTRLSALALALFLGSVIASQPAWIADTVPTYFQCVEFIGLLVLASTHVGRWGGLDFFIHHLITRPLGWSRS